MSAAVELTDFSTALHSDERGGQPRLTARPALERVHSDFTVVEPAADKLDETTSLGGTAKVENEVNVTELTRRAGDAVVPPNSSETAPTFLPAPAPENTVPFVEPLAETARLRGLRMGACFVALFLAGWNGGATGALIPSIEKAFDISYNRVALLFVAIFGGYLIAAVGTGPLARRIGFGRALCISVVVQLPGNILNSSQQKSFGLMCLGYLICGISFAGQLGLCNAYFAVLRKPLLYTGFLHGVYGLGAFASPQVVTAMITRGIPYHLFFFTNVGMNVPVIAIIWLAFRNLHALPRQVGEAPPTSSETFSFRDSLKSRVVWTLAIFLMLYVGAEESLGGWIVSYVLEVRKGTPEGASWVASSFYLGIAIGRIALPALNTFIGERRAIFVYLSIAIALEAVAWAVPVLASTAVATALVGLAISTFYTAAITMGGRLLPRAMHADAFSLISSVGQSGSAIFPLLVGIISSKKGIWVVEPTVLALLGAQGACWFLVPKVQRRAD